MPLVIESQSSSHGERGGAGLHPPLTSPLNDPVLIKTDRIKRKLQPLPLTVTLNSLVQCKIYFTWYMFKTSQQAVLHYIPGQVCGTLTKLTHNSETKLLLGDGCSTRKCYRNFNLVNSFIFQPDILEL